jgi:Tol biopolymer transport system component
MLALAAIAVAVPTILAVTAGATSQSRNGTITFRRYFDAEKTWGAVFTVHADGSAARQITHPQKGVVDNQPRWAPDGSLIAFTRCTSVGLCHIWAVAPDGTGLAPVGQLCPAGANEKTCSDDANASFSPDSKQIVFTQATGAIRNDPSGEDWIEHSALALINRDGSGRHVIYQGARFCGDLNDPVFSPDGKRLAFGRQVSGFSKPAGHKAMYVIDIDGSHLRRLTPWAENDGDHPAWSPNGSWLLFHSHVDDPSGQPQIILIHPDGSGRKQLTHFPTGTWVGRSSFSPDGRSIVTAHAPANGNAAVYTMRLDGSHAHRVTHSTHWDSAPDWGPQS